MRVDDDFDYDDSDDWERKQAEEIDRILAEYDRTEKNLTRALQEQITFKELEILELQEKLIAQRSELAQDAEYAARFFIKKIAAK